jgi:hypothetical protein
MIMNKISYNLLVQLKNKKDLVAYQQKNKYLAANNKKKAKKRVKE